MNYVIGVLATTAVGAGVGAGMSYISPAKAKSWDPPGTQEKLDKNGLMIGVGVGATAGLVFSIAGVMIMMKAAEKERRRNALTAPRESEQDNIEYVVNPIEARRERDAELRRRQAAFGQ